MARRKHYRKNKLKFKLKKGTVYSIFAFGLIVVGLILLLSFTKNGSSFIMINNLLEQYFGRVDFLFPFILIFFGFLFLRLKIFGINFPLGFLLLFLSLNALTRGGLIGEELFRILSDILTDIGANIVYVAGVIVGLIVFFNTSVDQIIGAIQKIIRNLHRLFPSQILGFFKNKKSSEFNDAPMRIKGGSTKAIPNLSTSAPIINSTTVKKEPPLLGDQLVSNSLTKAGLWEYPPLSLLSDATSQKADRGDIKGIAKTIEDTLESFSIKARVVEVNLGPAVTQYALEVGLGTKLSKITALANDLALRTEAPTGQIRIEAPIPGRNLVGIEIPNRSLEIVTLKTMLESSTMSKSKSKLTVSLGLDVSGSPVVANIAKMPHVLVAGTTGSGKSVLINSFIASLLFRASPAEVKLILIDPKRVELTGYNGIPHLMTPVIVEVEKILASLKWAMDEMDRRYKTFAERGVRNIDAFNELAGFQSLPYIVIFVDELADLMMFAPVEVEDAVARLAQMARATGIHLVISTQRPSVDVITGLIKANVPCRIAFNVSSMIDSRVILDTPGAEKLLGRGDMLYVPPDQAKPSRIQGAFVSDKEVRKLVEFLKSKNPPVEYTEEVISSPLVLKKTGVASMGGDGKDALFEEAIRIVCQYDRASASLLQRRLSIGYSRAARILDQLEAAGVVGPAEGSKPRDVMTKNADEIINALHQQ
jgi:DNA segregation ATPase FtsK/SpoIIIE, S-DNA-T family